MSDDDVVPVHAITETFIEDTVNTFAELACHSEGPTLSQRPTRRYRDSTMLLDAGADKEVVNNGGMTPLRWAITKAHTDIVNLLSA